MDKDAVMTAGFLVFIFLLTVLSHFLYAKGYLLEWRMGAVTEQHEPLSAEAAPPYQTQDECEENTKASCVLKLCDPETGHECDKGPARGWYPKTH